MTNVVDMVELAGWRPVKIGCLWCGFSAVSVRHFAGPTCGLECPECGLGGMFVTHEAPANWAELGELELAERGWRAR